MSVRFLGETFLRPLVERVIPLVGKVVDAPGVVFDHSPEGGLIVRHPPRQLLEELFTSFVLLEGDGQLFVVAGLGVIPRFPRFEWFENREEAWKRGTTPVIDHEAGFRA